METDSAENGKCVWMSAQELAAYRKPGDVSLPQGSGQKSYIPSKSWLEEKQLSCLLQERKYILSEKKAAKLGDLILGEWNPELQKVVVVKTKGKHFQYMGSLENGKLTLHPEEAAFLIETGAMEVYYGGKPLSTEEAYFLLTMSNIPLEKFQVYSHLSRQGYIVVRHQGKLDANLSEKRGNDQPVSSKKQKKSQNSELAQNSDTGITENKENAEPEQCLESSKNNCSLEPLAAAEKSISNNSLEESQMDECIPEPVQNLKGTNDEYSRKISQEMKKERHQDIIKEVEISCSKQDSNNSLNSLPNEENSAFIKVEDCGENLIQPFNTSKNDQTASVEPSQHLNDEPSFKSLHVNENDTGEESSMEPLEVNENYSGGESSIEPLHINENISEDSTEQYQPSNITNSDESISSHHLSSVNNKSFIDAKPNIENENKEYNSEMIHNSQITNNAACYSKHILNANVVESRFTSKQNSKNAVPYKTCSTSLDQDIEVDVIECNPEPEHVSKTEDTDETSMETAGCSRSEDVIELSYRSKHDSDEDFFGEHERKVVTLIDITSDTPSVDSIVIKTNKKKPIEIIDLSSCDEVSNNDDDGGSDDDDDDDDDIIEIARIPAKPDNKVDFINVAGKYVITVHRPPASLLPPNVCPSKSMYTINLKWLKVNRPCREKSKQRKYYDHRDRRNNRSRQFFTRNQNVNTRPNRTSHGSTRCYFSERSVKEQDRDVRQSYRNTPDSSLCLQNQNLHNFQGSFHFFAEQSSSHQNIPHSESITDTSYLPTNVHMTTYNEWPKERQSYMSPQNYNTVQTNFSETHDTLDRKLTSGSPFYHNVNQDVHTFTSQQPSSPWHNNQENVQQRWNPQDNSLPSYQTSYPGATEATVVHSHSPAPRTSVVSSPYNWNAEARMNFSPDYINRKDNCYNTEHFQGQDLANRGVSNSDNLFHGQRNEDKSREFSFSQSYQNGSFDRQTHHSEQDNQRYSSNYSNSNFSSRPSRVTEFAPQSRSYSPNDEPFSHSFWRERRNMNMWWKRRKNFNQNNADDYVSLIPDIRRKVHCWKQYKTEVVKQTTDDLLKTGCAKSLWNGTVNPLVKPSFNISIASLFNQLSLVKSVRLIQETDLRFGKIPKAKHGLEISYDVYLPDTVFRKKCPTLPNYRIVIVRTTDTFPDLADVVALQHPLRDGVPLQFGVVDNGDIAFFSFSDVCLPVQISML